MKKSEISSELYKVMLKTFGQDLPEGTNIYTRDK